MSETLANGQWLESLFDANELDEQAFRYANPSNLAKLNMYWKQLERLHKLKCPTKKAAEKQQWSGRRAQIVGATFEKFFGALFYRSKVFTVQRNVSTESSEIDLLISMSMLSQQIPFLSGKGALILGEAKCHKDGPSVQWVARLGGLMSTHSTQISFLLTGCESRKLNPRIRSEITANALLNKPIIIIGQKQLREVLDGKNILTVLKEQYERTISRQALAI